MAKRKHTKVVYKDLRNYWGWADCFNNVIELSKKLKGRKHLEIIVHEKFHILFPQYDEMEIREMARKMSRILWNDGYRKVVK